MQLKCVCLDRRFADLLRIARARGLTSADQLAFVTGVGTKCGMCRPLIDELIKTGKVTIGGVELPFPEPEVGDE